MQIITWLHRQGCLISCMNLMAHTRLLAREIKLALLHLAFPHICEGCGMALPSPKQLLCLRCLSSLPATNFHLFANNPVEKLFWGRIELASATSQYYFTKESLIQKLMHELKYRGNREAGIFLGRLTGASIAAAPRFSDIDVLVPLPLLPAKEKKRGYNQAEVLCQGMNQVLKLPVISHALQRVSGVESQTKKGRIERWQNMEGRFMVSDPPAIQNRHLLLVDDVVTTGATLEACARTLLEVPGVRLSIATLCFSAH